MAKKYYFGILASLILLFNCELSAQILNPVKWSWKSEKTAKNEYTLILTADIEPRWHTYSQFIAEGGPVPTSFTFEKNADVELIGKVIESGKKVHEEFDKVFEMNLKFFDEQAVFKQKVKIKKTTKLKGSLEFMVCDDSRCLPPDVINFSFDLKADEESTPAVSPSSKDTIPKKDGSAIEIIDSSTRSEIIPNTNNNDSNTTVTSTESPAEAFKKSLILDKIKVTNTESDKGGWVIFFLGLVGGLLALFTPCVFPMIPLTVSFFTKGNEKEKDGKFKAFLYGFFIFLIYVLLSVPFHILGDKLSPDVLNEISTNVWLNMGFFIIFVFFAFSFFGFYEIQLPTAFANRMSSAENVGGYMGIFFMASTLAIVSFSCTGPIIGSLLAGTLSQGAWKLTAGLAGFGVALGLPFGLFALFPSVMQKLPKSGGWLNSVKVVLGFIELALAIKFLSNADLVAHWGILKLEIFYCIWILIGLCTVLYLLGVIKFPHDSDTPKMSPIRIAFISLFSLFTGYLCMGLMGKPLALLSGFPPPMYYSIFKKESNSNGKFSLSTEERLKHGMSDKCPHDLPCFKDFFKAAAYAKEVNKPILIDFTGFACVNCRKMEENIWPQEGILDLLANDVVLVSLYVDDKEELPEAEQIEFEHKGYSKNLRTVGNKWSAFEIINFESNSQPLYVMLTPDLDKVLMNPVGYTPDAKQYRKLLDEGLTKFRTGK